MDQNNIIECAGFYFIHNFDSGNLGHVERVPTELIASSLNARTNITETPDYEFNLWTRPDCAGTEFENGNRTWFYFGIQASEAGVLVRLNLINLNKQGKMYNQGMAPVTRTLPGKPQWERIRDRPIHSTDDNTFTLSFKYRTADNLKATTFFAFTYPFSFAELQIALNSIDMKMLPLATTQSSDDIYYYRECLIYSLEGRRVDLLTITSHHGITNEREDRLKHLFPDNEERPVKFNNKKIIFISARVHPGETPSSFVFNGFLNLLLTRTDPIAIQLRRLYVFKMIPFLNPDGVARGHYRTDTRGVNLNRVYLNPSLSLHPTVYASRALIRYYHFGCEREDIIEDVRSVTSRSIQNISESVEHLIESKKKKGSSSTTSTYKRDKSKSASVNKSSTTLKQASLDSKRDSKTLSGEATLLAEQVYDMKLQEQKSLMSDQSASNDINLEETPSLLTDNVLRTCLGSNVHVSTSEELNQAGVNLSGVNPLRPLRDTLKNSISLLMESSSSATGESIGGKESRVNNIRMGWCAACRAAVSKLETTMPGITTIVPGYSAMSTADTPTYHTSIEEYREHQRQQYDALSVQMEGSESIDRSEKSDAIYFCTNCFKRYTLSDQEEIKLSEVVSYASIGVSCGDTCDVPTPPHELELRAGSIGDTASRSPSKDEKPKSPVPRARKKSARPPPAAAPAPRLPPRDQPREPDSGLYLYVDLHGHASKKGIFMYGNHFEDVDNCVECMLLPRIMSLNNLHFHFSSCNFTERNMYLKDRRDGMSREGSGRVAVLKATGLVRSYTLECNYNTGRLVNILPPGAKDGPAPPSTAPPPPKYTPHIFEEVGRSLGASILDLTGAHPNSRIPCSEHRNLSSVRDWLRTHTRTMRPQWCFLSEAGDCDDVTVAAEKCLSSEIFTRPVLFCMLHGTVVQSRKELTMSRLRPKTSSPTRAPLYVRSKGKVVDERKENTYVGAKSDVERRRSPPRGAGALAPRSGHELTTGGAKFGKKNEPIKSSSRTRYLADTEPKPKTLATKRRNILAIRKPNASKTQVAPATGKPKALRRSADDAQSPSLLSAKLSKRSFSRSVREKLRGNRCRAMASSSSEELVGGTGGGWEEVTAGTAPPHPDAPATAKRRPFPNQSPSRLKKIRLKTGL